MQPITNLEQLKRGSSATFPYGDSEGIVVRTKKGQLVAYHRVCPHEGGTIEWDGRIGLLLCECHLSLFDPLDGRPYRYSSRIDTMGDLTPIPLKVEDGGIFAG